MSVVVDASVLVRAIVQSGQPGDRARSALTDEDLHAPEVIDLEVASALRRLVSTRAITGTAAGEALGLLATGPVQRYPHAPMLDRIWELRENVAPSDAAYIALAEALDAPVVTSDGHLARATSTRCRLTLVP